MNTNFKVKVAVRVRPSEGQSVVQTDESEVFVLPSSATPANRATKRAFAYDKVFPEATTQSAVYAQFGQDIVQHSLEGYNACIFAYGQTGSGKSHTMLGTQEDPGLIPQICEHLFEHVENVRTEAAVTIRVSFLEIYNEHIRDLLVATPPKTAAATSSLRIRGIGEDCFVAGLSEYKVESVEEVVELLQRGARNRATAATKMNDTSSRSHAVVGISIKQQLVGSDESVQEKVSVLRLVDLAGSERAAATGATGERLREGGNINKSLVTLGRVISVLAEPKRPGQRQHVVPYRDSVLTRLLQPSLGGNSRTAMIACVSPSESNFEQTLSTLRYADQAKRITTIAHVNEDVISDATKNQRLQQMQKELMELRQQLSKPQANSESLDESKLVEDAKLAKLVQFYEDEAAREKVRNNILEQQRQQSEQRTLALADYIREISGNGLSSIDLRNADSFERIVDRQEELEASVTADHTSIKQSLSRWRALVK